MISQTANDPANSPRGEPGKNRIESLREQLLPDSAFEEEIAEALACSRRTVQRFELPYDRVGQRRVYSISGSRTRLRRATLDAA